MITELLTPELLFAELDARNRSEALTFLARRVAKANRDVSGQELLDTLNERERQASTALGEGVAIPHARIAGLDHMIAAFARSRAGIDWHAPDGTPAHLIFMLAGPAEQPGTYLKTLAAASRLLRKRECRTRLMGAMSAQEMFGILRDEAAHNGGPVAA